MADALARHAETIDGNLREYRFAANVEKISELVFKI